jgi:hypothetical protein
MVLTLGYQGNQTRHLLVHNNWNAIAEAHGLPFNPKVNFLNFWNNSGSANFNAGIATLTHNFSRGFQASAQYTWAKAMDENSGPYFQDPYPYNTHAAYGRSDYNVQNAFKLFGLLLARAQAPRIAHSSTPSTRIMAATAPNFLRPPVMFREQPFRSLPLRRSLEFDATA